MKTTIALVLFSVFIAGCATEGKIRRTTIEDGPCGAVEAYTYTNVHYGDGSLSVRTRTDIAPGSEWRIYLKPKPRRGKVGIRIFGDSVVSIDGKAQDTMVVDPDKPTLVR